jgi:choline dehydrogenase
MFSYMKKAEQFHPPTPAQVALGNTWEPSVHGMNGPIDAGYFNPQRGSFIYNSYVSSVTNLSGASSNSDDNARTTVQKVKDLCTGAPRGAARFFYSIIPGGGGQNPTPNRRASSAEGYIYPFVASNTSSPSPASVTSGKKGNLIILVGHQASRILWKDRAVPSTSSAAQATGVEFISTPAAKDMPWPPAQRVHVDQNPLVERDVPLFQVNLVQTKGEVIVASGALGVSLPIYQLPQ